MALQPKGNTLLNFCGIKNDLIEFVVDAAPSKQGNFYRGVIFRLSMKAR